MWFSSLCPVVFETNQAEHRADSGIWSIDFRSIVDSSEVSNAPDSIERQIAEYQIEPFRAFPAGSISVLA
jgi:hypothetical protein